MINLLIFIFLGFIQGIAEPIPVSSSGHLLIFQKLFGSIDKIDFELLSTITNFGSFLAICFIFKDRIIELFKAFFGYLKSKDKKYYNDYKYCWLVVIATIPAGIMGLIVTKLGLFDFLEENVKFVGITLLITAAFLYLIKDFKGKKDSEHITFKDAIIVGLFQVVALLPGISRSGSTIVGGMFRDFNFSFILYIPISIATTVLGLKDLFSANLSINMICLYLISMIVAFIFTYIATKWFKNIVKDGKLIYFVYYCLIVGFLVFMFL
jgi:undecaprenyl-diphosphatase